MATPSGNSHLPGGLNLKGGVLVFFPSYGLMEAAVDRWKQTGMYERLLFAGGGIVIEPRAGANNSADKVDQKTAWKEKYNPMKKPTTGGFVINTGVSAAVLADGDEGKVLGGLVAELDAILASKRRCIMLAVCRGKVSEGIDFRDSKVLSNIV